MFSALGVRSSLLRHSSQTGMWMVDLGGSSLVPAERAATADWINSSIRYGKADVLGWQPSGALGAPNVTAAASADSSETPLGHLPTSTPLPPTDLSKRDGDFLISLQ